MSSLKLLYVEDEIETRQTHVRYLTKNYDFDIIEANNGSEAFALYLKHKPQILLTDITMPEMCGLTLIEKIREIDKDIKVIVLSAVEETEKLLRAMELNLTSYQIKPISRSKLNDSLEKAIQKPQCIDVKYYFNKDIYYDIDIQQLISNDKVIKLTKYQIKLLELFINHKNQFLSSEIIFDNVWDDLSEYNSANVRTLVKKLRKNLPDGVIETQYGGGYKLV